MGKVTKRVVVELEFESATEEAPFIKDWWLRNMVSQTIQNSMPYIQDRITDVTVEHKSTNVLPKELTVDLGDLLHKI